MRTERDRTPEVSPETCRSSPGPLVRPYAMTGGRTRPLLPELDMISVVVAVRTDIDPLGLGPEYMSILSLSQRPISVAEISAHLDLPLTVVKVLVSDLVSRELLLARGPLPAAELPELNVLQAVLDGIRRL